MNTDNDDLNAIAKYEQLQRRVQEMEQDKSDIQSKLLKAQKHVKRLRMERLILLEQLDEYYSGDKGLFDTSDSDASGDSGGELLHLKRKRSRPSDRSFGNPKKSSNKLQETAPVRKKKDPNAPKGPGNVFFLYCRMEREHFKDELPTENLGEVTRLLGQKWKAMTDDEKKKYYDIYDREQEEYQKAMKSYKEAGGGDAGRTAVSEMNNTMGKNDNGAYSDVDILQDDVNNDADNNDMDDDEASGIFLDEDRTPTINVSVPIVPDINSDTASTAHQWYDN